MVPVRSTLLCLCLILISTKTTPAAVLPTAEPTAEITTPPPEVAIGQFVGNKRYCSHHGECYCAMGVGMCYGGQCFCVWGIGLNPELMSETEISTFVGHHPVETASQSETTQAPL